MASSEMGFGRPFNWCDRLCERCPLASACPLARIDLDEQLAPKRADVEVSEVDWQDEFLANTELPRAKRLRSLGIDLVVALTHAQAELPPPAGADRELIRSALTLAMKVARVSGYFEPRSTEAWSADAVPNLLLVKLLMRSVRSALGELSEHRSVVAKAEQVLGEIERLLAPLLRCVDARARETLSRLMAANQAPSPFCTLDRAMLCSRK